MRMNPDDVQDSGGYNNNARKQDHEGPWGWNWLERWMRSQPDNASHLASNENSYVTLTTATNTTNTDNMSEKTVEMDVVTTTPPPPTNDMFSSSYSYPGNIPEKQVGSNSVAVPSYMAPTQSARAKARMHQGTIKQSIVGKHIAQSNPSMKKRSSIIGSIYDSSSSGGVTTSTTYPEYRSPSPKINMLRHQPRQFGGYNPDSSGGEDWRQQLAMPPPLDGLGWRHNFA